MTVYGPDRVVVDVDLVLDVDGRPPLDENARGLPPGDLNVAESHRGLVYVRSLVIGVHGSRPHRRRRLIIDHMVIDGQLLAEDALVQIVPPTGPFSLFA